MGRHRRMALRGLVPVGESRAMTPPSHISESDRYKVGWDAAWDYMTEAAFGMGYPWSPEQIARDDERRDVAFRKWRASSSGSPAWCWTCKWCGATATARRDVHHLAGCRRLEVPVKAT